MMKKRQRKNTLNNKRHRVSVSLRVCDSVRSSNVIKKKILLRLSHIFFFFFIIIIMFIAIIVLFL